MSRRSKHRALVRTAAAITMLTPLACSLQAGEAVDWDVLDGYCMDCHNFEDFAGGTAFELYPRDDLLADADVWELTIRKLRTGMMPPADQPRPERQVMDAFVAALAGQLDEGYKADLDPGTEGVRRLNRSEYRNAIRDILNFDPGHLMSAIPHEAEAEGFDNNVEVLSVSPTLIDAYANAAIRISREAVGDNTVIPSLTEYPAGSGDQQAHREGLPLGTRGGFQVSHNFPLDASYELTVNLRDTGIFTARDFCRGQYEVVLSLDGQVVPLGDEGTVQLDISAGPHRLGVALRDSVRCAGVEDLYDRYNLDGAITSLGIFGPFEATGPGHSPSRQAIFSCYPEAPDTASACARQILTRLATLGYRQPLTEPAEEVAELMRFYAQGDEAGGFETGIQHAIARLLMDPRFLYSLEAEPADLAPGQIYEITDLALATRLSLFLWSSVPDEELLALAADSELSQPEVLERQVRRMLADPRSEALVDNFAGQWLRLRELDEAEPQDRAFTDQLLAAFRQETSLAFADMIHGDQSLLSLIDSDHTWLNETLAAHYGIDGVRGDYMRRVALPSDSPRRGLLGKGSILTATSVANRTSPVIRGTWIVEDVMGAPVPTPPPGVETDLSEDNADEKMVDSPTLRARLEMHRDNPGCASCHQIMDPIGLALENFDLVGRWRTQDNGHDLDTHTRLMDGTPIDGPVTLRKALLDRGDSIATTMTEKLMSYALGRHLHASDMYAVRDIVRSTAPEDYRFSAVVLGIINSPPFRMKRADSLPSTLAERGGER